MSSDSESDENEDSARNNFHFWNDWKPPKGNKMVFNDTAGPAGSLRPIQRKLVRKHKNWSVPKDFGLKKRNVVKAGYKTLFAEETVVQAEKEVGLADWGPRLRYGVEYGLVDEDAYVWNIFQLGLFGKSLSYPHT